MHTDKYQEIKALAKKKVLDYLTKAAHTKWEVVQRIQKVTYANRFAGPEADQLISELVEELEVAHLIDDKRYAEEFVFSVVNSSKPRNNHYLKIALLKKHIDPAIISEVLGTVETSNEQSAIMQLIAKKAKFTDPKDYKSLAKLRSYLYSKGYSQDLIKYAIDTYFGVK